MWGAVYLEWFWVTFFLGFLIQLGVAGVFFNALTKVNQQLGESKQALQAMYMELETKLKQKDHQLSNLMAARQARAEPPELASLAHELKQPIMAIQLNAEYLMSEQLLNAEQENEVLNDILQDNRRAAAIIQALRNAFAKPVPLHLLPVVDLSHFVQDATRRMGKVMNVKGVQLELNINPGVQVRGEDIQLGMVIDNLFKNAIEAMDKTAVKKLSVSLSCHDSLAVLDVWDSGPGVPIEIQEKIFEMNFTTKAEGMGIGLWLSRRIVQECAGQLLLVPRAGGAHFRLTLPCLS
jgi:signal transduction histidine kinase